MTVNFKHIVDISNVRPAYDLVQLAPQIEQYKKEIKKAVNAKQAKYSNKWSGELNHMVKRAGRCNNNSAAFAILLNHVGIKCKRIVGKVFSGKTQMNHFWNSAVVDGVTWYYDIDVEIHHYGGSGVSAFSQYRKTLEQSKKNHIYEAP
jgi:transglutaminase/protease-like cytokinesis protein 3